MTMAVAGIQMSGVGGASRESHGVHVPINHHRVDIGDVDGDNLHWLEVARW
jgi:hypothetical protein